MIQALMQSEIDILRALVFAFVCLYIGVIFKMPNAHAMRAANV